jgi:hypothetical protein
LQNKESCREDPAEHIGPGNIQVIQRATKYKEDTPVQTITGKIPHKVRLNKIITKN